MAGLKVTLDAALRARDVSRLAPGQEALAEQALPERLASRRSGPEPQAAPAAVSQPPGNRSGRPSAGTGSGRDRAVRPGPRPDVMIAPTPPMRPRRRPPARRMKRRTAARESGAARG